MKMPWMEKTGLAKGATIFATLLLVSLGLCGFNFVAVIGFVPMGGGASPQSWRQTLGVMLTITGMIEFVGMAIGIAGLLSVGIAALFNAVRRHRNDTWED
jgi:hypothetical protein